MPSASSAHVDGSGTGSMTKKVTKPTVLGTPIVSLGNEANTLDTESPCVSTASKYVVKAPVNVYT